MLGTNFGFKSIKTIHPASTAKSDNSLKYYFWTCAYEKYI